MKLGDIKKVGVAGGGTMGFGIAINFALGGYPVTVLDLSEAILTGTRRRIDLGLKIMVDEGLISAGRAESAGKRISLTTDIKKVAAADFITEAITERLEDKQTLFNELDRLCPPETIIMTNTSTLLVSNIARGVRRQDKVGLTHYFDPPHFVPGLEVAKGPGTSDETFEITFNLMLKLKKVPVKVLKERSGYLLNSIQYAMAAEAQRLWAEGFASAEDIEKGITATFGFRNPHEGPMMHNDLAGIWKWPKDVLAKRAEVLLGDLNLKGEAREKMREKLASGTTWFVEPAAMTGAIEIRDREYARRLKDLYWGKMT